LKFSESIEKLKESQTNHSRRLERLEGDFMTMRDHNLFVDGQLDFIKENYLLKKHFSQAHEELRDDINRRFADLTE